jgi:Fe-S cluster assembly iron-binding protein IscA
MTIHITVAAITQLKAIQFHHPADPVVRISVRDLDESRLSFSITLEATAESDDYVQQVDGLTIAMDQRSASRMEGVTVDYTEATGFRFLHDDHGHRLPLLTIPTLN